MQSYGYVSLNADTMNLSVANKPEVPVPLLKGNRQTLLLTSAGLQAQVSADDDNDDDYYE